MNVKNQVASLTACRRFATLIIGALSGFMAFAASAVDETNTVDSRADEFVRRMGNYLGEARYFSVDVEIWQDVQLSGGQRVQAGRTVTLQIRRPDRLHAAVHSTRRNRELIYDGHDLTLFNRADNLYGTVHTSGPLDQVMDLASDRFGIAMPLEDFLRSDPYKGLIDEVISGTDIGPVSVMGVPCEHLAFSEDDIDWQLWIETGAKPVPRKFVITYKDEPDSPQFTAIFSNWDFTTPLPDFVFQFEPPAGANEIEVKEIKAETKARRTEAK